MGINNNLNCATDHKICSETEKIFYHEYNTVFQDFTAKDIAGV